MSSTDAITVDGLTKRFGAHEAVTDLSFSVPLGKVTGFLGPNGAGKTTTIRMILGLVRPTVGRALIDGRGFADLAAPARHVGVLIEGAQAHPGRTARDHLRVLAAERSLPVARVDAVLDIVELADASDRRVGAFSLGMRQRLDLAAALLGEPRLLILDEPANGLDPAGIRWLREFLRSYARDGGTVLVSSHQLGETSQLADDVVVIGRGHLITHTTVDDLTRPSTVQLRTPQLDVFQAALRRAGADVRVAAPGIAEVSGLLPEQVGHLAAQGSIELHELTARANTLEDVFLELTSEGARS